MTHRYFLGLALLAFTVAPALAAEIKIEDGLPGLGDGTASICDTTGYKQDVSVVYSTPLAIPDNAPAGIYSALVSVPADGSFFTDVTVVANLTHTWIGDVVLQLEYFANCADAAPTASANVICRPGGTLCGPGTGVGCSSNFIAANELRFNDAAAAAIPSTSCLSATNVAAGCYLPSGTGAGGLSTAFNGLLKGGCFRIFAQDNAAADTGAINSWGVLSKNESPVPTASRSWGGLKSIYR